DRAHHTLVAQLREGSDALGGCLLPVLVRVVQIDDVEAVDAESLQTLLDAAEDRFAGEVELASPCRRDREPAAVELPGGVLLRHEGSARLGGQHELVPRVLGQQGAQAALRVAESVVRGGVEEADPATPGGLDGGTGLLVGGDASQVAELCTPEAESGEGSAGAQRRRL